jgi:hypothetical protein
MEVRVPIEPGVNSVAQAVGVTERLVCGEDHPHEAFAEAAVQRDDERMCRLAKQVERCPEALPPPGCHRLRFPLGTTYAEAARRILRRATWAGLTAP